MNGTHTLRPGRSEFCLPVLRDYDDSIAENNETFTLSVSSTSNDVQISPTSITVEIVDDDGRSDACPQWYYITYLKNALFSPTVLLVEPAIDSYTVAEGGLVRVCAVATSDFERTGIQVSLSSESGSM